MDCQSRLTAIFIVLVAATFVGCERKTPVAAETPRVGITPAPSDGSPVHVPVSKPLKPVSSAPLLSEPDALPPRQLAQRLRAAPEPEERGEVVGELWTLATPEAVEILRQHFFIEHDTDVKADIVVGLVEEQKPETRETRFGILSAALTPTQPAEVREAAVAILVEFDDVRSVALLQNLLQDPNVDIREAAQEAIELRREKEAK